MRYIPNYHGLGERIAREFKRIAYAVNGEPEWTYPTLENSWSEIVTVRFRKLGNGLVVTEGRVNSGALGNRVYQLPEGYRPGTMHKLTMDDGGSNGLFQIETDGDVVPTASAGASNVSNLYAVFFAER